MRAALTGRARGARWTLRRVQQAVDWVRRHLDEARQRAGDRLFSLVSGEDVESAFFRRIVEKTNNFGDVRWLNHRIWQNVLDAWTIQEVLAAVRPALLIECGTHRGGSALYFANLFDLLGEGRVVTVDVERMHQLEHPRITFLLGSSVDERIVRTIRDEAQVANGPVMVILDSDHSAPHVLREMEAYGPLVTPGSYLLVQDGVIDKLAIFAADRPGPLVAIQQYLPAHPEFELDRARSDRFIITHHPCGWLRRRPQATASRT